MYKIKASMNTENYNNRDFVEEEKIEFVFGDVFFDEVYEKLRNDFYRNKCLPTIEGIKNCILDVICDFAEEYFLVFNRDYKIDDKVANWLFERLMENLNEEIDKKISWYEDDRIKHYERLINETKDKIAHLKELKTHYS